ncbi:TIGR01777 family oxidoreductase [Pseudactinotalea sp. HY158]|uniref:TIGR01777 family oxidoreductase n=1 Tax=Pseudactinotalea sp. HY158 TaxID=2654547 RepID=UPI00129CC7DC|nr:TIGR01777 family oxidoreductase [Pseudactinotalea sp. HY158]QGH69490.1 TIGR01777 family protein [Pseudactinotalea sp. HY158]
MVVLLAGASGLLGSALTRSLAARGQTIRRLVRREPTAPGQVRWDPSRDLDGEVLDGVSAVINLGGAGVSDRRWTRARKRLLLDSRVGPTSTLSRAIARKVAGGSRIRYLQAGAIGWYGDGGEHDLTESMPAGSTPLAHLCRAWEAAAGPAREAGAEVVTLRTGIVLSPHGGAMGPLLPLIKLGLAGPLGPGTQWWAWIHVDDWVGAVIHVLESDHVGPVNLTAPHPSRNRDVIAALARAAHRPSLIRAPGWALRVALDGFGEEILRSQRAVPHVLTELGYSFVHPEVDSAARAVMCR